MYSYHYWSKESLGHLFLCETWLIGTQKALPPGPGSNMTRLSTSDPKMLELEKAVVSQLVETLMLESFPNGFEDDSAILQKNDQQYGAIKQQPLRPVYDPGSSLSCFIGAGTFVDQLMTWSGPLGTWVSIAIRWRNGFLGGPGVWFSWVNLKIYQFKNSMLITQPSILGHALNI